MSILSPPMKPTRPLKTARGSKVAYTINKTPNRIYAIQPKDKAMKISIVSFMRPDDAQLVASMFEEYRRRTSEWPDMLNDHDESLILPTNGSYLLQDLSIIKWDVDDLKFYCSNNMLDLITLSSMKSTNKGFSVRGESYLFDAPLEFYQERFSELYHLDSPA
jgi:hypothetical protein